jgi:predicted ATP-grasp superfamily ATP-dependent carboligase
MIKGDLPSVILMDCEIRSIEGIISSFGKRGIKIIALTAEKDNPPGFKSKYVRYTYNTPEVREEQEYLKFLIDLPHRGVLVYSSDSGAEFVSRYKCEIQDAGYLINIPDIETFRTAFNKDSIFKVCAECGVPTMRTKDVYSIDDIYSAFEEIGLPLILKATRLAGGRYWKIKDSKDIPLAYKEMNRLIQSEEFEVKKSGLIIQEYIEHEYDEIYCCESYYSLKHVSYGFLSIQKLRPDINYDGTVGSRLFVGETIALPELELFTKRILDHLNWNGFAHLDWLYSKKHQSFLLCEINPRLPGFSNFITKIGFDMAWYYYTDLTKMDKPLYRFKRALYFEALRHPGDLTTNLLAVINGHLNVWSYIKPYVKTLTLKYTVVFDVFYGTDLSLTWENYKIAIRSIVKRIGKI